MLRWQNQINFILGTLAPAYPCCEESASLRHGPFHTAEYVGLGIFHLLMANMAYWALIGDNKASYGMLFAVHRVLVHGKRPKRLKSLSTGYPTGIIMNAAFKNGLLRNLFWLGVRYLWE